VIPAPDPKGKRPCLSGQQPAHPLAQWHRVGVMLFSHLALPGFGPPEWSVSVQIIARRGPLLLPSRLRNNPAG